MFDEQYPNLATWILRSNGFIELGQNDFSYSTIRILDIGGMIWESEKTYTTIAAALADAEIVLGEWRERMGL